MCIPISVVTKEAEGENLYNQGLSYYKEGSAFTPSGIDSLKKAIAIFNKVIDANHGFPDVYYMRGIASIQFLHFYSRPFNEEQERLFREALKDFEKVLQLDKNFYVAYAAMGNTYDRYGDFDEAVKYYDKALEKADEIKGKWGEDALAAIYFSRGRAYHRTLKHRSVQDYEKAYEYNPHSDSVLMHISTAYLQAGRWEDAYDMAKKSVKAIEEKEKKALWDYRAYLTIAKCHIKFKNYNECVEDLKRGLEIAPFKDPDILLSTGRAYKLMGNAEKADEYFNEAIKACDELIKHPNPLKPVYTVYNTRGLVLMEIGDYKKAIEDFEKTVEIAPENYPHAHTHYKTDGLKNQGIAYTKMGDKDKAHELFTEALNKAEKHGLEFAKDEIREWI
jgi:tetratricopeptide (TPR) repeat protein